ncbi:hypothetical protein DSCA_47480 [Desulfosarcina alkanivorans]|uniref:Uncharacterized protein n=1 Tax=Desulfosarcina alkanivorans TaxID=571177 RepID=A0A5K7YQ14_9BACT|nr:hypothetical protein DSCA_47480 [Desulfosarcina alkanivorans]
MKAGARRPYQRRRTENSFRSVVLGLERTAMPASVRLNHRDGIGGIR